MKVKVANGQQVISDSMMKDFEWWLQGHTFKVDVRVLDITAYDHILGMDLLEQHRPITCDWLLKWIEFDYNGSRVKLQGLLPTECDTVAQVGKRE
jgi:hypothetical protein